MLQTSGSLSSSANVRAHSSGTSVVAHSSGTSVVAPQVDELLLQSPSCVAVPQTPQYNAIVGAIAQIEATAHGQWIWAMMDSGANCTLTVMENAQRYAAPGTTVPVSIGIGGQGKGQSTTAHERYTLPFRFQNGVPMAFEDTFSSTQSRKCIINQNWLWHRFGLYVDMQTQSLKGFTDGSSVPLYERGDQRLWTKIWVPVLDASVPCAHGIVESVFGDAEQLGIEVNSVDVNASELDVSVASLSTT